MPEAGSLPETLYAQAVPWPANGRRSLFDHDVVTEENVLAFVPDFELAEEAADRLRERGFTVYDERVPAIGICGPPSLFEEAFGCSLLVQERMVMKSDGVQGAVSFVDCVDARVPGLIATAGTGFDDVLVGVAIERPRLLFEGSIPPKRDAWHLAVPGDVALACNAERAHRKGYTGSGVAVAIVDTGFYRHPYFIDRGYRIDPVRLGPGAEHPDEDALGHGTVLAANLLAVAPDARLMPVKMNQASATGALIRAARSRPHVIVIGWGGDVERGPLSAADRVLAMAVAHAAHDGIVVVAAAGNGHFGFPGQHPDVICVGGAYRDANGRLRASDYASGFTSGVYPNRDVPDVSGLVGMRPAGEPPSGEGYLMVPLHPGSRMRLTYAERSADAAAADDGWAAISGTSAAAAQVAGVCALIKQAVPEANRDTIRRCLRDHARDVAEGHCFDRPGMSHPAIPGAYDRATGGGLVNAAKAMVATGQMHHRYIRV
ncbi:S8 family serine peptidase [Thermopolyspora sp. NPDC052614]|uniref:S8 family serine peptidase n=1 Tax=Thermopolyspora sp. NPDC052614 TaxID=3155682 RepID=UPI003422DC2C